MSSFSVYGAVDISVDPALKQAAVTFARELVPTSRRISDSSIAIDCDATIGHGVDQRFGVTGAISAGRFLYPDGRGHYCEIAPGQLTATRASTTTIRVCCPSFSANVLLEWVVLPLAYFPLAAQGWTPLHASGVADPAGRHAVVLAAWSGVGKTNMVLTRMRSRPEAVYLGDDIVLVHETGTASPSSRTVSAYGYNRRLLESLPRRVALSMWLGERIRRLALRPGRSLGRLQPLLLYASSGLANHRVESGRARAVEDFEPCPVTAHIRCVSASGCGSALAGLGPPAPAEAAAAHLAVLDYEFIQFQRLIETWRWATGASADPWGVLRQVWRRNLEAFFTVDRRYYSLALPLSDDPEQTCAQAWADLDLADAS